MERILLESALRSTLIAICVGAGLSLLGIRGAAARHRAWEAVLLVMLALPAWTAWGPRFTLRVSSPVPPFLGNIRSREAALTTRVEGQAYPVENIPLSSGILPVEWPSVRVLVYLSGVAILLARLGIGGWKARALVRGATLRDGQWSNARCVGPLAVGWLRPAIVLPDDWQDWPAAKLNAVLTHEVEHLRRRDPLIRSLALFHRALFWFNPLAWWIERRLAALAEEACDAVVLDRGHDPHDYANYLMEIARRVAHAGGAVHRGGLAMADGPLTNRLRCILEGLPVAPVSRIRAGMMAMVCVMSSTVFAAGLMEQAQTPSPRPATVSAPAVAVQEHEIMSPSTSSSGLTGSIGATAPAERIEEHPLNPKDAIALLQNLLMESVPTLPLCDSFKLKIAPAPDVDWAMAVPKFPLSPRAQSGDDTMVVVPCQESALENPMAAVWGTRDTAVSRGYTFTIPPPKVITTPLPRLGGSSPRNSVEKQSRPALQQGNAPDISTPGNSSSCKASQGLLHTLPLSCRYADAP